MFNSGNFFLMLIIGGSMQQLWGMIRSLQMIALSALVNVGYPINLFIFLQICILFANMDILSSEERYEKYLKFIETDPMNDAFAFFGIGDKNFINNSGSYLTIQVGLIIYYIFLFLVNRLAVCFATNHYARKIGIRVYENNYFKALGIIKLYMESYFDIVFCSFINLTALWGCNNYTEFRVYFSTPSDFACSVITIFYTLVMPVFPVYGAIMIYYNRDRLEKKKVQEHLGVYLEGVRLDQMNSALFNVFFLIRRLLTGFVIVIFSEHPYF